MPMILQNNILSSFILGNGNLTFHDESNKVIIDIETEGANEMMGGRVDQWRDGQKRRPTLQRVEEKANDVISRREEKQWD